MSGIFGGTPVLRPSGEGAELPPPPEHEILHPLLALGRETFGRHFRGLQLLSREENPKLLTQGLFHLARRLEQDENYAGAAQIYSALNITQDLNRLQGTGGTFAEHLERFGRSLPKLVFDPGMLVGMGVTGLAFQASRYQTLKFLLQGERLAYTGALGARPLAYAIGLGGELLAFTLSGKVVNGLVGPKQDWSFNHIFHELKTGAVQLGLLRSTGRLFGHLAPNGNFSQIFYSQAGMFTGLLAAQTLEHTLGWIQTTPEQALAHSLAMLLAFNLSHGVGQRFFGGKIRRVEEAVAEKAARLDPPRWDFPSFSEGRLETVGGAPLSHMVFSRPPRPGENQLLSEVTEGNAGTVLQPVITDRLESRFRNGSILIQVTTRQNLTSHELHQRMKLLDDALSSLLLNFPYRGPMRLKGLLAEMLRPDLALQSRLVGHLEKRGHRILADCDLDTAQLRWMMVYDHRGQPEMIFVQNLNPAATGAKPYAASFSLQATSLGFPIVTTRIRYSEGSDPHSEKNVTISNNLYNGREISEIYKNPTQSSDPNVAIQIGPESPYAMKWIMATGADPHWRLLDRGDQELLVLRPNDLPGLDLKVTLPQTVPPAPSLPISPPEEGPPRSRMMRYGQAKKNLPARAPTRAMKPSLPLKPPHADPDGPKIRFDESLAQLKRDPFIDYKPLLRSIEPLDFHRKMDALFKLAELLVSPIAPLRAATFGIFSKAIPRLVSKEATLLKTHLETTYPKAKFNDGSRYMVYQVEIQVRERLKKLAPENI